MAKYKNKVKAIIFSDLHINKYTKYNQGDRRTKNALDVLKNIKLLTKRHKTVSLFLGDLMHKEKNITNELLSKTLPFFSSLWASGKFKTYAITGNHDQSSYNTRENPSPSYIETLSKTFKGIECMDFRKQEFDDWDLYGIPYLTHDIGLIATIKEYGKKLSKDKVNVLMLHTTMPNARDTDNRVIKSGVTENEFSKAVAKFDIVLCGHIHKPEEWGIAKTTIIQVGAPQQQRATDRHCEMGYWIMYDNFEFEFVPFKKYPKFVELEPGQVAPDNKDFYYTGAVQKANTSRGKKGREFTVNMEGYKLARNYMKTKEIKDKAKRKALVKSLKKVL